MISAAVSSPLLDTKLFSSSRHILSIRGFPTEQLGFFHKPFLSDEAPGHEICVTERIHRRGSHFDKTESYIKPQAIVGLISVVFQCCNQ